jgi:hypothetical protein
MRRRAMMKPLFITGMAISFALATAMAMAADQRSYEEIGQNLFFDPAMGGSTNVLSCNSCHSRGYRLDNAATNSNIMPAIRQCLIENLGGSKEGNQVDMRALRAYIVSIIRDLSISPDDPSPDMMSGFQPGNPEGRPDWKALRSVNSGKR